MKRLLILAVLLLLFGCISLAGQGNVTNTTNDTEQNVTPPQNQTNQTQNQTNQTLQNQTQPKEWERYYAGPFSFEYPVSADVDLGSGIFTATSVAAGQTSSIVIVIHFNTTKKYGANRDDLFKRDPTQAASDFLLQDRKDDPADVLDRAHEAGSISTFSVYQDAYAAEMPFKVNFTSSGSVYSGHAMDIFVPERSLQIGVRIFALNPDAAEALRDRFLVSFRLE